MKFLSKIPQITPQNILLAEEAVPMLPQIVEAMERQIKGDQPTELDLQFQALPNWDEKIKLVQQLQITEALAELELPYEGEIIFPADLNPAIEALQMLQNVPDAETLELLGMELGVKFQPLEPTEESVGAVVDAVLNSQPIEESTAAEEAATAESTSAQEEPVVDVPVSTETAVAKQEPVVQMLPSSVAALKAAKDNTLNTRSVLLETRKKIDEVLEDNVAALGKIVDALVEEIDTTKAIAEKAETEEAIQD